MRGKTIIKSSLVVWTVFVIILHGQFAYRLA